MKNNQAVTNSLYFAPLIPDVLNDSRLRLPERTILSLLIQLSGNIGGYCFATNKYFAENLNCSLSTVSKSLKKLRELGYITKNVDYRGRLMHRYVRIDLLNKSVSSNKKNSLVNITTQPTQKQKHSNISINEINSNYFSTEIERELVEAKLNSTFHKWGFYIKCKNIYNDAYPIEWNKKSVTDLIKLCNRMNEHFEAKFGKIESADYYSLLKVFELFLSCKPDWFSDSLPRTFLLFFDKITSQKKFLNVFKNVNGNEDSFF